MTYAMEASADIRTNANIEWGEPRTAESIPSFGNGCSGPAWAQFRATADC